VFEAAVRDAGVAAVMDAYNKVNGVYCTENGFLNNTVLKQEWGFDGVIMSDWGATHSTVRVALNGMDLEMPSGFYLNPEKLLPAIEAGAVPESVIDDKVRRILRMIVRSGFLDRPQRDSAIPLNDPRSAETALRVAREGIVLLENRHGALPLDRAKIRSIAVLGPGAHPDVPAGWGSSFVVPFHATSVLDGLQRKCAGQKQIDFFSAGVGNFATARFETRDAAGHLVPGLRGEYFANATFAGEPVLVRIDQTVNFDWVSVPAVPVGPERFSVRWSGQIRPATSGLHVFRARSDDGIRVFLDDQVIIDDWDDHAARPAAATIRLEAERLYSIRIEYKNSGGGAVAQVGWDALEVPDVVRNYDAAIVCVGFDGGTEGEGFDRSFELPNAQNELIRQVTEKNANTIVILFSGGNVDMHPWVDRVAALLHAWYPGQEGGTAIAEVLLGDVTPAGKLPVTFEKKLEDNPAFPSYPSEDGGKTVRYAEDLFMGYRGYDRNASAPRYPFGFGLSYTSFKYSALTVTEAANRLEVEFSVENIGDRPGAEVAQIYVSGPSGHLPRAVKELKGFERVELGPGEIRRIKTAVPAKGLAYFDPAVQQWRIDPGTYRIMVGGSSRDLQLTQEVEWKAEDR
jgi:beta-glucosidase